MLRWLRRGGLLDADEAHRRPRVASRRARSSPGFDILAGVSVPAQDREGRERLLRYCARPPLSLERLSVLADGRVAYRIKNPRGKQTHRVMSPIQFLARLCALIPPRVIRSPACVRQLTREVGGR